MNQKKFFLLIILYSILSFLLLAALPLPAAAAENGIIWGGSPQVKQVALTFDDGPSPRYTPEILHLLRQNGVHATFFVLGDHVELYPRVVKSEIRDGEEIGNHSFDHPRFTKSDQLTRERELERTTVDLELLGCHPVLFRPPYSAYDHRLVTYLTHTHREMVLWGIDSGDWQGLPAAAIIHNVLDRVHPGAIIIFHDNNEYGRADRTPTVEALKVIVPALRTRGYRMVTVSELVAGKGSETHLSETAGSQSLQPPVKPVLNHSAKKLHSHPL
jgi:peptidoglycan-N-acetylglucosamine deacetylase